MERWQASDSERGQAADALWICIVLLPPFWVCELVCLHRWPREISASRLETDELLAPVKLRSLLRSKSSSLSGVPITHRCSAVKTFGRSGWLS